MSPTTPSGHCWGYCYLGTLFSLSSQCNSFEDRVHVDEIYQHPFFKAVALTGLENRATGVVVPVMATRVTFRIIFHRKLQTVVEGAIMVNIEGGINLNSLAFNALVQCQATGGTSVRILSVRAWGVNVSEMSKKICKNVHSRKFVRKCSIKKRCCSFYGVKWMDSNNQ